MGRLWVLLLPVLAAAQLPPADVSGVLLERDAPAPMGQFSLRAADNQVFRFQFDAHTTVDRLGLKINVQSLNPGEKIEVLSAAVEGSLVPLARSVLVLVPVARTRAAPPLSLWPSASFLRSEDLTFSGVVAKFSPQFLVIRARDGDHTLLIRKDTRYLANGGAVESDALRLNMRVFVVAGTDVYQRLEAYRIVWGRILEPGR